MHNQFSMFQNPQTFSNVEYPPSLCLKPMDSPEEIEDFALEPDLSPASIPIEGGGSPSKECCGMLQEQQTAMVEEENSCKRSFKEFSVGFRVQEWSMINFLSSCQNRQLLQCGRPRKRVNF